MKNGDMYATFALANSASTVVNSAMYGAVSMVFYICHCHYTVTKHWDLKWHLGSNDSVYNVVEPLFGTAQ